MPHSSSFECAAQPFAHPGRSCVNPGTMIHQARSWAENEAEGRCEARFCAAHAEIRRRCERQREPGVALFALGPDGVLAQGLVRASSSGCRALIAGRHTQCHVQLAAPQLALRQLALIVLRWRQGEPVRLRLVDLRTRDPVRDERGAPLGALEASGPLSLLCGDDVLFVCPVGPTAEVVWHDDPRRCWAALPRRVYVDSRLDGLGERPGSSSPAAIGRIQTIVQTRPGPAPIRQRMVTDEESALGQLTVRCGDRTVVASLGPRALRRGVLLGRYDRCDVDRVAVLQDSAISRVHLMLCLVDDQLWAVDTASTCGSAHAGQLFAIHPLSSGDSLALAGDAAQLRWRAVH